MNAEHRPAGPAPRVTPLEPSDPGLRADLQKTVPGHGEPPNLFKTLAHHPLLMRRINALGGVFAVHGSLPPEVREAAILRVAWRTGCTYETAHHRVIAARAGMSTKQIERATYPVTSDDRESTLSRAVDQIVADGDVTDETWQVLSEMFTTEQTLEFISLVAFYCFIAVLLRTLRVELDPGI